MSSTASETSARVTAPTTFDLQPGDVPAAVPPLKSCTSQDASLDSLAFTSKVYREFISAASSTIASIGGPNLPCATENRFTFQQVLFHQQNPFAAGGGDRMVDTDSFTTVRNALANALKLAVEDGEVDLANIALVDVMLELLHLCLQYSFSDVQAQQALLLFQQTHSDVTYAESEEDLRGPVAVNLAKRIERLMRPQTFDGFEQKVVGIDVAEEVPDEAAVAAVEQKFKETKGKKQPPLADQIAALPKVQKVTRVTKVGKERNMITIDAYFSPAEADAILRFFRETLLQQWRLYRLVATVPRGVSTTDINVAVEDLPVSLIPLSSFTRELDHEHLCARREMEAAAEAAFEEAFQEIVVGGLDNEVYPQYVEEHRVVSERDQVEREGDEAAKMSHDEYKRSIAVLKHRLAKDPAGAELDAVDGRLAALEAAVTKAEAPPPKGKK